MVKAVLQYTDCLQDGKTFFSVLSNHTVIILKSKSSLCSTAVKVTVIMRDYLELHKLIGQLNRQCTYEVRVVKVKTVKEKKDV